MQASQGDRERQAITACNLSNQILTARLKYWSYCRGGNNWARARQGHTRMMLR